jgi:Terpene synthase family 2, C-terminal metal binding
MRYFIDLTEDGECSDCIDTAIASLSSLTSLSQLTQNIANIWSRTTPENKTLKDCKIVITAFHHAVSTTTLFPSNPENEIWKIHFWHEVKTVVRALQDEKPLRGRDFSMNEWMRLRILTISARPFMVLARASAGLPTDLNDITTSPRINQMQILVQSITGIQNDLLGWQKDHIEKNPMCVVEILIRDGMPHREAFEATLATHNDVVRALLNFAELGPCDEKLEGWSAYVQILVGFCHAMATWMLESKRYQVLDERMRETVSKRASEARFADQRMDNNDLNAPSNTSI